MQFPLPPVRNPVRLSKTRQWTVYAVGGGLWLSGVIWLIFHYFLMQKTEFGPSPHPLEHWWLALHGLFAMGALWVFGLLWNAHIVGGWKTGRRRISGSVLFVVLAELIVTGWLIYYPPSDGWLAIVAWLHWGVGLAIVAVFLLHRFWRAARSPS